MLTLKRQIRLSKLRLLISFVIALFMVVLLDSVVFASLPYTYSFDDRNGNGENKDIIVDFDYDLNDVVSSEAIYIVPAGELSLELETDTVDGNLEVEVKGLDPRVTDYQLVIEPSALEFDGDYNQVTTFKLPFKYFDIAPGFKTTFVNGKKDDINKIFKRNAPRDIYLNVPYLYFDQIRTVHRYNKWLDYSKANLTNIDIWTKEQVDRVDVSINDQTRRLSRHTDDLFTTGYAGLESTTSSSISKPYHTEEGKDDINLKAYDKHGRNLGKRFFRLSVRDKEDDFIIDDYIDRSNVDDVFGKQYTLLELMEDETLLETILERISVEDLDKIGVHYMSIEEIIDVGSDANLLASALANVSNEAIRIDETVELDSNLIVDKDVRIVGAPGSRISFSDQDEKVKFTGDSVTLSGITIDGELDIDMDDGNVYLDDITVNGSLDIDVGDDGDAHLYDVIVNGETYIFDAGTNSIILSNFKTDELIVDSKSDVRIVFEEKFSGNIVVKGDKEVKFKNNTNDTIQIDVESDKGKVEDRGEIEINANKEIHVERFLSIDSITDSSITYGSITDGSITYGSITLTSSSIDIDIDIDGDTIEELKDGKWVDSTLTQSAITVENGESYSFRVKTTTDSGITKYSNPVSLNPVDNLEIISDPITTEGSIKFGVPVDLGIEDNKEDVIFQQRNVSDGGIKSVTGGAVTFEDGKISVDFEEEREEDEKYQFRMIIIDVEHKRAGFSNKVEETVN